MQGSMKKAQMYWLIGRKSKLAKKKTLLYKALLKPIWTYGIQLYETASVTNIKKIQTFQSSTLRCIMNAPWYVNNHSIHRDIQMDTVINVVKQYSLNYHQRILNHPNSLAASLSNQPIDWSALPLWTFPLDVRGILDPGKCNATRNLAIVNYFLRMNS